MYYPKPPLKKQDRKASKITDAKLQVCMWMAKNWQPLQQSNPLSTTSAADGFCQGGEEFLDGEVVSKRSFSAEAPRDLVQRHAVLPLVPLKLTCRELIISANTDICKIFQRELHNCIFLFYSRQEKDIPSMCNDKKNMHMIINILYIQSYITK